MTAPRDPHDGSVGAADPLPRDDGLLFDEPWQAQAFAMVVALQDAKRFTEKEWADALAREIAADRATGAHGAKDAYYRCWIAALERLAIEKGLMTREAVVLREAAWDRAIRATPHGSPILLANDPESKAGSPGV